MIPPDLGKKGGRVQRDQGNWPARVPGSFRFASKVGNLVGQNSGNSGYGRFAIRCDGGGFKPLAQRRLLRLRRRWLVGFVAVFGVTPVLFAQTVPAKIERPEFVRLRGQVVDLAAHPWQDVRVIAESTDVVESSWHRSVHRVEAQSDARGRFEMRIYRHRSYRVFGIRDLDTARYRRTQLAANVVGRTLVRLVESSRRQARLPLHVTGLDAWTREGVSMHLYAIGSVRADVPGAHFPRVVEILVDEDGRARLPYWPGDEVTLQALGTNGSWAFTRKYSLSLAALDKLGARGIEVGLDRPASAALRIVAGDKPVADARLFLRWRDRRFELARTGVDGIAKFCVPLGRVSSRVQLGVGGYGMWVGQPKLAPGSVPALSIERGHVLTAQLTFGERPARGLELLVFADKSGGSVGPDFAPSLLRADARGRFRLSCLAPGGHYTILALPSVQEQKLLPPSRVHRSSVMLVASGDLAGKSRDLGPIDLRKLRLLDVRVVGVGGEPGARATVRVELSQRRRTATLTAVTDRRGRVQIPVSSFEGLSLGAVWAHGSVPKLGVPMSNDARCRVLLESVPFTSLAGTVVDPKGKPVVGATVRYHWGSGKTRRTAQTATNARGRFEVSVPVRASTTITASYWRGSRRIEQTRRVQVGTKAQAMRIELPF